MSGDAPDPAGTAGTAGKMRPLLTAYVPEYRADHVIGHMEAIAQWADELILFSASPGPDADIRFHFDAAKINETVRAARSNGVGSILLSFGGGGRSEHFAKITASSKLVEAFAAAAAVTCETYGLDGIDLDWEGPSNNQEVERYGRLITELHRVFEAQAAAVRQKRKLITVAMHYWQDLPEATYRLVDRISLMAYDIQSSRGHSHIYEAKQAALAMVKRGVPSAKLVLGLPAYGRGISNPGDVKTYAEIVDGRNGFDASKDIVDGFFFNGPGTAAKKAKWVRLQRMAGIMVWEAGQDSVDPRKSIMAAISAALKA